MAMPVALSILLWFGVITIWVQGRWAVTALEIGGFLSAGISALWTSGEVPARRPHLALSLLTGVAAWGLAQIAAGWTVAPAETERAVLYWLAAASFFYLGARVRDTEYFLSGLLWFGAVMSALTLAQLFSSQGKILWLIPTAYDDRIFGTFASYNNYAAFVELIFPLALWRTLGGGRHWWRYAVIASLMYGSVVASASRAGTVLVTVELIVALALAARRGLAGRQRTTAVLVGAVVFSGIAGYETLWRRLWGPDPYIVRREYYQAAVAMTRARPLTGFGLGTWTSAYPAYAVADFGLKANHAHSEWGQWAAEGGAGVVLAMVVLFALAMRCGIRNCWAIGLVIMLLHGLVDYPLARLGLASWWFAILGLAVEQGYSKHPGSGRY